jgi:hypothetical protein
LFSVKNQHGINIAKMLPEHLMDALNFINHLGSKSKTKKAKEAKNE